jgi:hypothetical protein
MKCCGPLLLNAAIICLAEIGRCSLFQHDEGGEASDQGISRLLSGPENESGYQC